MKRRAMILQDKKHIIMLYTLLKGLSQDYCSISISPFTEENGVFSGRMKKLKRENG
jgi:hypothetical protein